MDLRQIEAFVAVATLRSFRAAATRLHLTQPAVSTRIAALEAEVGESLFVRDQKPIALTEKGKRILPYAEQMLDLSQNLKSHRGPDAHRTIVRIGLNSTLVRIGLAEMTRFINDRVSEVNLEYEIDVSHRLVDRTMAGNLDLCLMHAPTEITGLRRRHCRDLSFIWVSRPEVAPTRRLSLEELAEKTIVTFGPESAVYRLMQLAFRRTKISPKQRIFTNYSDALVELVKKLDAVGSISKEYVQDELQTGHLVEVDIGVELPAYEVHVLDSVTASNVMSRRVADLVIEFYSLERRAPDTVVGAHLPNDKNHLS